MQEKISNWNKIIGKFLYNQNKCNYNNCQRREMASTTWACKHEIHNENICENGLKVTQTNMSGCEICHQAKQRSKSYKQIKNEVYNIKAI
jgi:hypothetical protein